MLRKHLVIVGGGWAGLRLVRQLKNIDTHNLRITLLSDASTFRYNPALYRVATGHREREAIIPLGEILQDIPNVDFIQDTVTHIDRKSRTLKTKKGKTFHYDYAVLALGVVTSYFGIPGLPEQSYSIKTPRELRKLRTHLHQELINEQAPDKNYIVVGAGPTGVELAAAMTSYMKSTARKHGLGRRRISISLVEAAPRVLPISSIRASKKTLSRLRRLGVHVMLNKKVESENESELIVSGKKIPTKTVIWTAGVTNNPFFTDKNADQFTLSPRRKVIVDDHLMVDDHVYVIGDNAETPYSGLGLTAVHNARYVSIDIKKRLKGKRAKPYHPLVPATVLPVGARWAVFQYRKLVISGIIAAFIRNAADLIAYSDIVGARKAIMIWLRSDQKEETCVICKSTLDIDTPQPLLRQQL